MESITLVSTPVALSGTFAILGAARKFARPHSAALWVEYTRDGGSGTGRPLLRLDVSPVATGDVWYPMPVFDTASFASGQMDLLPLVAALGPSALGTSRFIWPDLALRHGARFRIMAKDADGVNPGTIDLATLTQETL